MKNTVKTDDIIFNFFKQICDEKDDKKCVELGNSWINAMETNLTNMEANLDERDKAKHKKDIQNNRPYRCRLDFHSEQFSITPGQAAVFYSGDVLLGGGIIEVNQI